MKFVVMIWGFAWKKPISLWHTALALESSFSGSLNLGEAKIRFISPLGEIFIDAVNKGVCEANKPHKNEPQGEVKIYF